MQKIEDEFVEKLFDKSGDESNAENEVVMVEPEETPEVKKARANVTRILNDMMKRQQEELDANKFDVKEVQKSWEFNVGDAKVTG